MAQIKNQWQNDRCEGNHSNNRLNLNDVETPFKIQRLSDWKKSNKYLYAAYKKQISTTWMWTQTS